MSCSPLLPDPGFPLLIPISPQFLNFPTEIKADPGLNHSLDISFWDSNPLLFNSHPKFPAVPKMWIPTNPWDFWECGSSLSQSPVAFPPSIVPNALWKFQPFPIFHMVFLHIQPQVLKSLQKNGSCWGKMEFSPWDLIFHWNSYFWEWFHGGKETNRTPFVSFAPFQDQPFGDVFPASGAQPFSWHSNLSHGKPRNIPSLFTSDQLPHERMHSQIPENPWNEVGKHG